MNVLEKIFADIEEATFQEDAPLYVGDMEVDGYVRASRVKEIIRSHMDEDWIPVEERLPEEHDSIFAKFKGTNKWGNAMFEKRSDEVNVTYKLEDGTSKTGTSYTLDGKWKIEKENGAIKRKIVAWRPLPEPYKPKKDITASGEEHIMSKFMKAE